MRKDNIKRVLFHISLMPYFYVIVMSIFYALVGYGLNLGKTAYGINAIGNYLSDLFSDVLSALFDPIIIIIAVIWISYQMYYFVSVTKNIEKVNKKEKKSINLKKIFFIISILCWVVYFLSGIWAFFFGSSTGGGLFNKTMEYGMDAMLHTWFWNLLAFSLIPVLPISLLYIIIYLIIKYHKNKK